MSKTHVLPIVVLAGWMNCSSAQYLPVPIEPIRALDAQSLTDDEGKTATDISGIACLPQAGTSRVCLVINDEDRSAQFANLEEGRLTGGRRIQLIGKGPSDTTIGEEPHSLACSEGKAKFKDLDGEAVAFAEPYFYIAGSHGCSRHNKFRVSSFILARVKVNQGGNPIGTEAETTYRLAEVFRTTPGVSDFFGKDLNGSGGLNLEGIAVIGGKLIVGLRAPVIQGEAFLLSVDVGHLFARKTSPPPSHIRVIPVALGENVGIRDLATLPDGRLLILAGSAQEQKDVPYSIFLFDMTSSAPAQRIATLKDVFDGGTRGKAEGISVLDAGRDSLRVVVVFDSLPGGGPREYRLPLQ